MALSHVQKFDNDYDVTFMCYKCDIILSVMEQVLNICAKHVLPFRITERFKGAMSLKHKHQKSAGDLLTNWYLCATYNKFS